MILSVVQIFLQKINYENANNLILEITVLKNVY